MDPFTIAIGYLSVVNAIGKTSAAIASFVHQYREAQQDMEAIYNELGSLKLVLQILAEDTFGDKAQNSPDKLAQ
jgi:hypothetical protein